jgi:predicted NBD/HSP70 family sugar kinase
LAEIITGNYRLLKDLNSNVVLNLVRTNAPISGAKLAKITGMRPSTIHNILKTLERQRLITRIGTGDSTKLGGRRPTLWKIRGNYGYVIGIQLEINEIEIVLVDVNSKQIDEQKITTKSYKNLSEIKDKIVKVVDTILIKNRIDKSKLLGIGFGVSGLVNTETGKIIKTSLLPSSEQPIDFEEYMEQYFGVPIYVENDANAAVLAEKWFGKAAGVENIIYILTVVGPSGFGIGFGLILNDQIYRGSNMYAGETELFDLNIEKILKTICGCEEPGLTIRGQYIDIKELQLDHLINALEEGNELAIRFFVEIGSIVGEELIKVINMLDPYMVVVGGEILDANSFILDPIRQSVNKKLSNNGNRQIEIVGSSFSRYSIALGAATIILKKIFQDPSVDHVITMNKAV